jgi:hypothetical protein
MKFKGNERVVSNAGTTGTVTGLTFGLGGRMVEVKGDDGAKYLLYEYELELIPEFEAGEEVEISDCGDNWYKRIYLGYMDGKHWYRSGTKHDSAYSWKYVRKIKQPEIAITVKINGKEAKLSDISEDTLKKIREAE